METLTETLTIANATIEDWTHRKTEKDGLKLHFNVSAPLPKLLSEQLRCAGIYDMDTRRIDLLHKLKDTELLIPVPGVADTFASFFPDVVYKFKASRDEEQFTIAFSVHISTRAEEMHEILKGAPDNINISVRPRQGQLFEGGTRVEVAPGERVISQEQAHDASAATDGAAPLAPAAVMGGTHQKRKPREERAN